MNLYNNGIIIFLSGSDFWASIKLIHFLDPSDPGEGELPFDQFICIFYSLCFLACGYRRRSPLGFERPVPRIRSGSIHFFLLIRARSTDLYHQKYEKNKKKSKLSGKSIKWCFFNIFYISDPKTQKKSRAGPEMRILYPAWI